MSRGGPIGSVGEKNAVHFRQCTDKPPRAARFLSPINLRLLTLASLLPASTFAADAPKLPAVAAAKEKQMSGELRKPAEPTAKKMELLSADDFERAELGKDKGWAIGVPTFPVENGTWTLSAVRRQFTFPEAA